MQVRGTAFKVLRHLADILLQPKLETAWLYPGSSLFQSFHEGLRPTCLFIQQ